MGGFMSYLWWGFDPDEVSPISGLTKQEVYLVQKSWTALYADPLATGNEFFRRYLAIYPEDKKFFWWMKDLPEEEYLNTNKNKAHILYSLNTFNTMLKTMDKPEIVAAMLRKIGVSHGRRNINEDRFYAFKKVVLMMFTEQRMDDLSINAWNKTLDFWFKNIFETLHIIDNSE